MAKEHIFVGQLLPLCPFPEFLRGIALALVSDFLSVAGIEGSGRLPCHPRGLVLTTSWEFGEEKSGFFSGKEASPQGCMAVLWALHSRSMAPPPPGNWTTCRWHHAHRPLPGNCPGWQGGRQGGRQGCLDMPLTASGRGELQEWWGSLAFEGACVGLIGAAEGLAL